MEVYFTKPDRRPPKSRDNGETDTALAYADKLRYNSIANICGANILMRTNSKHIYNWWKLNWYETDEEADGFVFVTYDVKDYDPHLYYNLDDKVICIVNSEYYGAVKSTGALGLAGEVLKKQGKYPIHGSCVGYGRNKGAIIIAPTGIGKTTQLHELLYNIPSTKVHSDDYVFISFVDGKVISCATEKDLYMRTEIAQNHPVFINIFNELPLENVKDECYWKYANSRVMMPRHKFPTLIKDERGNLITISKATDFVTNEVEVEYVFLLTRDDIREPITQINKVEILNILKEGKYIIRPGAGAKEDWGKVGYEPFYNPYPPELDHSRQEELFSKLYDSGVKFYLLNTGSYKEVDILPHKTHMYIRKVLEI